MHKFLRYLTNTIEQMDMQDWALVMLAMVFLGFICMRGYGSRSDY